MPGYVSRESADRWNRTAQIVAGGGAGSFTSPVPFADSGAEPLLFKNVSGETIPPYACVQLTGTTESGTHTNLLNADQPADATGKAGPYGFNGPSSVAAGEIGTLQSGPAYRAIYNSGTQTAGIKYHPIKDSWEIKGAGFGKGCGIWSYVGTDDIIADTIRVKSCAGGETACDELEDLSPGTYRGTSGATTAPGETGPVIVTGCDGDVTIDAVNHSGCTFYLGDRISVHIDPCCVAHFDGCKNGGDEPACCDRFAAVCVNGQSVLIALYGGSYEFDVVSCTGCVGATLEVSIACSESTVTATWTYTCGETTATDTLDWSGICNDPPVEFEDVVIAGGGVMTIVAGASVETCGTCDLPEQPCEACTAGTVTVGATSFDTDVTGIESSTLSISTTSLETDTIFTITAVLSMVGSANTEAGKFSITATGTTCLYASPDSNKPGLEGPPVITNAAGCDGSGGVAWDLSLITEESITCTAVFRFNSCTTNAIGFFWDSDFIGADESITWAVTCGECGPESEGGGV
jgi:hypothetical protein